MTSHRVIAFTTAGAIIVAGPLLGAVGTIADDAGILKPGASEGTISDKVGAGALDDRQIALAHLITDWSETNPEALADSWVSASDLSVHLSRKPDGLTDSQLADLTARVHAAEPSAKIVVRNVEVSRAEVEALKDRIRAADASLRELYGPVAANTNDDVSAVEVTVEDGDVAAIQNQLRAQYGPRVTVSISTFRTN